MKVNRELLDKIRANRRLKRALVALVAVVAVAALAVVSAPVVANAPKYIVPPIDFGTPTPHIVDSGWAGIVTSVTDSGGALHVDLSIVNNTNQWSAMDVGATKAKVTDSTGSHDCAKQFVGTSVFVNDAGWYLPPGFVMKGYTGGTPAKPVTQALYVECAGVAKTAGQTLSIDYEYIVGPFNYYIPSHYVAGTMKLNLDKVVTDLTYPVAEKVSTLAIAKKSDQIAGINGCTVRLVSAKRTDTGLQFEWDSFNPTGDRAYIHIGIPPVIGSDGILYGFYQSPHLSDAPITPAGGDAIWTTTATVPPGVTGLYLLVPVETQQQKYFVDHVLDITDL